MTLASRQFHCMQEKPLLEKAIFLTRCRLNNVSNSRHACLKSNSAVTISIMQRKVEYFNSHLSRISISIKRATFIFWQHSKMKVGAYKKSPINSLKELSKYPSSNQIANGQHEGHLGSGIF